MSILFIIWNKHTTWCRSSSCKQRTKLLRSPNQYIFFLAHVLLNNTPPWYLNTTKMHFSVLLWISHSPPRGFLSSEITTDLLLITYSTYSNTVCIYLYYILQSSSIYRGLGVVPLILYIISLALKMDFVCTRWREAHPGLFSWTISCQTQVKSADFVLSKFTPTITLQMTLCVIYNSHIYMWKDGGG